MATISLGSLQGAPGTYINEINGNVASAGIASFNTVYMLVEVEESVSTTVFGFNTPVPVTSLTDYRILNGGVIPESRIPLLSYNCVNAFFQNAQIGDLRVVRVGTPNQISEIRILPDCTAINNSGIPGQLTAGEVVYVQLILNGLKLVAGNGSTGYTSSGEWLGVPVVIPVDYIDGDAVNNRKISKAITVAIAGAIESNPNVKSSIYVRDFGLVSETQGNENSQDGFIQLAAAAYDGTISVVSQQTPVGSITVLMSNAYEIENIVGLQNNLERVPQDYIQCINTAFDGYQQQGYLITPTAYAQFDSSGRAKVGAAAAAHCQGENFKWMALADPGPFLVTDINKYNTYTPHLPASDLVQNLKYLVDNSIYQWTGESVTYDKLPYQGIVPGYSAKIAVEESVDVVASGEKVGAIDPAMYTISSQSPYAEIGKFVISSSAVWPAGYHITQVVLSDKGADFAGFPNDVYVVAPPFNSGLYGPYPSNGTLQIVYLAETATEASAIYTEVSAAGGSSNMATLPTNAINVLSPTGSTVEASYETSAWDLMNEISINGQKSNLIQNKTNNDHYVNTTHLPGTLQDPTIDYKLAFASRTLYDPGAVISSETLLGTEYCKLNVVNHELKNGQQLFFTQPIKYSGGTKTLFRATNVNGVVPYYVKVLDTDNYLLASSYSNYLAGSYVTYPDPAPTFDSKPTIAYTKILGGKLTAINLAELATIPLIRGRKYGMATGNIFNTAEASDESSTDPVNVSIYLNNSSVVLGQEQIFPYGETENAGWLANLELVDYGNPSTNVANYLCTPTVRQSFATEAYLVPAIESIYGGDIASGGTVGVIASLDSGSLNGGTGYTDDVYENIPLLSAGSGTNAEATITVSGGSVTLVSLTAGGEGYQIGETLTANNVLIGGGSNFSIDVDTLSSDLFLSTTSTYTDAAGLTAPSSMATLDASALYLDGVYFSILDAGTGPSGSAVVSGDRVAVVYDGSNYNWVTVSQTGLNFIVSLDNLVSGSGYSDAVYSDIPLISDYTGMGALATIEVTGGVVTDVILTSGGEDYIAGETLHVDDALIGGGTGFTIDVDTVQSSDGDMSAIAHVCYGSPVELSFTAEQTPPSSLWRFDAITSTEIMDAALRGVGFNGEPQAVFVEAGVDNVNRLFTDSQMYSNYRGFIAFYGPYIKNSADVFVPPSPYVTGVALRRYRAEGFQYPPAGVKYQLIDATATQIAINSAQQNLLNPDGCNAVRTLPGYPDTAVYIWGGRTRINKNDPEQRKFQFVNTRVIQNVVYGTLRRAFDNQTFSIVDGFGFIFNQITSVGTDALSQLWIGGALFGQRASDAFQVICDDRINTGTNLENGVIYVKFFDVPVPTLERIEGDLIRVSVGQMSQELESQGLG